MFRNFL